LNNSSIEELTKQLGDKNIRARQRAERELVALGKIAVELLIYALEDDSWTTRCRAASALGKIRDTRAIEPLIQRFTDHQQVQIGASCALGKIVKPAVEYLLQALEDEYTEVRLSAAATLGNMGDVRAVQPLIKALKDNSPTVRLHTAEALGKMGDSIAVESLKNAIQDPRYSVREAVAISLTKLSEPIIGPILQNMELRAGLIHNGIIRARERKRYSAALEPLTQALSEGNVQTRLASAVALGTIGGSRPIEPLTYAVNNDKDEDVRIASVQSLGIIGRAKSKEVLRRALNDDSHEVRSKALGALSFLRDTSAVEPLLNSLRDADKEVRWDAAESLGYLGGGNRVAERVIRAALQDAEDGIREEAAHALEKMEEEKEHEALYAEIWEA